MSNEVAASRRSHHHEEGEARFYPCLSNRNRAALHAGPSNATAKTEKTPRLPDTHGVLMVASAYKQDPGMGGRSTSRRSSTPRI